MRFCEHHLVTLSSFIEQNCQNAGKEREICNWKEVTESNNLNISTVDSDMGTGYGDGDVEDAYHAIFGEEKKCTKGQKGSNVSTEPSPTAGSCCNVDNVLDAAAAALSGSKRDRKGRSLEVKKEDDLPAVLSKTVKNEISSFSVGKVVIITSGEYCDWEGEILCIETSQSYPKSASKSKQSEAFYVVALQYSDGSPLDCCVLVSHSMITSTKLCSSNEEQLDDISDDSDMADSTMKYTADSHCSTAPLTLDKPPKLSFQISPIRPGRNDKLADKDKDKSNIKKGDIASCDKFFSEECIEMVEAFTADLVQSQIDSEIVLSVLNEIKTNIEFENKEQIKNEKIRKNDMNKNNAGWKGVNDSMCEKDTESREIIQSIPDDVKVNIDVIDKCESSRNSHRRTYEGKEIFPRGGIVHAEEKAEHEKLKTGEKVGISNIEDTATKRDSGTKNEIDINGSVDSAEVAVTVAVEEIETVTDAAITLEIIVTHGDEVSGGSNSGLAVLSEISVNGGNERNGSISNSVILTMSAGAENVRDNDGDNSHSNDNTISNSNSVSNSMNENDNENDSDAPLQPLSSSQIRYQQYAALRPLDMSIVGRRVRITAAGNKHRYANCDGMGWDRMGWDGMEWNGMG